MSFEAQIVDMLAADATVAGLVVARIFPHPAPQGVASPFITYQITNANQSGPTYTHRATFDVSAMQIDCWHEQLDRATDGASHFYGAVADLARAVRTGLDRKGDPTGDDAIEGIQFTDWNDLSDEEYARRALRFDIYVRDP